MRLALLALVIGTIVSLVVFQQVRSAGRPVTVTDVKSPRKVSDDELLLNSVRDVSSLRRVTTEKFFTGTPDLLTGQALQTLLPGQQLSGGPPDVLEPDDDCSSFAVGIKTTRRGPHGDNYIHVYVSPESLETMLSGNGEYPVGTLIVKHKFEAQDGDEPIFSTVMRKRELGFDAENGDWEYAVIDGAAKQLVSRGRNQTCIDCHKDYARTDFVTRAYIK